ncbi:histidine--tRNA ligase [Roseobacter cerasinus]|uniref:Histidine--tRNA ligase n=1 Tax=Roseobacter cerasinus TaxID=2602289 RepID=A0A640VVB7_9RHOB|nr:histidine--tRNA ligase [Roseobacter cerasinus]GFE51031.1 histidine--tRNA ligase [Roseobacter cerasinus]
MAKPKKTPRPKAETPKGFRDYFGAEVTQRAEMLRKIAAVYHRYGFDALESSGVETVEALGKFLPDVDRPNEGVFAWQEDAEADKPGDWLALRYDLTAPLARVYAQHQNDLPKPYRRYAMGPVWRNEKPGPGRFRQFYQCDADTVGAPSVAADAEICAMLADCLEEVGIPRGDYVIRVNNRKVLNGVLEVAGLADDDKDRERGIVLRAIDKLDRLGVEGVQALLGEGRKDESGDFTNGAGLSIAQIDKVLSFVTAKEQAAEDLAAALEIERQSNPGFDGRLSAMKGSFGSVGPMDSYKPEEYQTVFLLTFLKKLVAGSKAGEEGVDELGQIYLALFDQGYGPDRIIIDPSVVRGLGYYTGPVYEAELTFDIQDEKGRTRNFGSVAGGGRYDDLVKRFTGHEVPATGVSIGVDRLLAALQAKGRMTSSEAGPVVVTVMDRDRMADYQKMVADLRRAGIRAEVYLGNPKNFGNQLKYADKRGSPVAVIEGGDEKERGVVQIKDLILGAQIAESATLEEWKDRPSQFEVPRDDLVAKVREILRQHGLPDGSSEA